jgi:uncharacterized protein with GYD domain
VGFCVTLVRRNEISCANLTRSARRPFLFPRGDGFDREDLMAKTLYIGSYTATGAKNLLTVGAAAREAALRQVYEAAGLKMEAIYWTTGKHNFVLIIDGDAAAGVVPFQLAVQAAGVLGDMEKIELFTSSEVDGSMALAGHYKPA